MSWIEEIKTNVTAAQVAGWIGMTGRLRSWGPCPACSAERRGKADRRGPVGMNGQASGWECHACGTKGDAVELACLAVLDCSSSEADAQGWKVLREWFAERGVDTSDAANPGKKSRRAPVRSVGSMVSGILGGGDKVKQGPIKRKATPPSGQAKQDPPPKRGGLYAWEEDLVPRCEAALWGDTAEAEAARRYLMEVRKLSEGALRTFRLGLYVRPDGSPHVVSGRPVVVIPLIDEREEPVSAKFRSVPTPGTCDACGGEPKGCRKCRDYRNCKGRPLPLFGSHLMASDLEVPVILVEGELDVLAAYTYGLACNVVSTTAGAGSFAEEWLDLIEPYEAVVGFYDADEKGDAGFAEVAEKLGVYRCSRATPPMKDLGDCLMAGVGQEKIERALQRAKPMHGIEMRKAIDYADQIEILINEPWRLRGVPTGWEGIDEIIGGWRPGVVVVTGETGQGKAQPVDEPVLTPGGWRKIGDLAVGDLVVSADGTPTRVNGVFPQGLRKIKEVEFTDGARVRCDREHLWAVRTDTDKWRGNPYRVLSLDKVELAGLLSSGGRRKWNTPLWDPKDGADASFEVDPYLLGVLIGDGCLTNSGVRMSLNEQDHQIVDRIRSILPDGLDVRCSMRGRGAMDVRIVSSQADRGNPLVSALVSLGLYGKSAQDKFIPDQYLLGSRRQRVALLQGLMDTDGTASCGVQFNTSSSRLADDVCSLVRSLGGCPRLRSKLPKYSYKGRVCTGRRHYTITMALPEWVAPFFLARKADAVRSRIVPPVRKILAVRDAGEAECVCISVEHPSSLYVTRDYVVTHNTTWTTAALLNLAHQGAGVMVTSFEQEPIGTVQKLLRNAIGGDFTNVSRDTRLAALQDLADLPLWILDHYGHITPAKLVETIRYAKRRHGVGYFLVDHLGFLIDSEAPDERRAIEAVVRALAIEAKRMQVTVFLVCHPHNTGRDHRGRPNKVTARDLKGASAIRQDADDIIVVTALPPTKDIPWPRSEIVADKVRSDFGVSGGRAVLAFDPGSVTYADTWEETPAGQDGLLVPRKK